MQTLIIKLTNQNALNACHSLEEKHYIRIVDDADLDSPAFLRNPLPLKAFKQWVNVAEGNDTIGLKDAKQKWAGKRKQLQKLTR